MSPFTSILHSKQYTFLIGVDKSPVTLHSGAIAALSSSLERLVNGPFKEAQENVACFPDIEVEDFEKICAVAYGAELPVPEFRTLPLSEVNTEEDCLVLSSRIIGPESVAVRNNKLTAHVLRATIGDLNFLPNISARTKTKPRWENTVDDFYGCKLLDFPDDDVLGLTELYGTELFEGDNEEDKQKHNNRAGTPFGDRDVSGVLLGYARIYIFAEKYQIAKLWNDAGSGLRNFLARLDIY